MKAVSRAICAVGLAWLSGMAASAACVEVAADGRLVMADGAGFHVADVRMPWSGPVARRARGVLGTACEAGAVADRVEAARDWRGAAYARLRFATRDGGVADVSEVLLREGLARYAPRTRGDHAELLAAEDMARAQARGLWSDPDHAVRGPGPDALMQVLESWQIVRGLVVAAEARRGTVFLNFGSDWRTDFTVAVPKGVAEAMAEPPDALAGARVEVRGFVESVNGPAMWLRHPGQLRVVEPE